MGMKKIFALALFAHLLSTGASQLKRQRDGNEYANGMDVEETQKMSRIGIINDQEDVGDIPVHSFVDAWGKFWFTSPFDVSVLPSDRFGNEYPHYCIPEFLFDGVLLDVGEMPCLQSTFMLQEEINLSQRWLGADAHFYTGANHPPEHQIILAVMLIRHLEFIASSQTPIDICPLSFPFTAAHMGKPGNKQRQDLVIELTQMIIGFHVNRIDHLYYLLLMRLAKSRRAAMKQCPWRVIAFDPEQDATVHLENFESLSVFSVFESSIQNGSMLSALVSAMRKSVWDLVSKEPRGVILSDDLKCRIVNATNLYKFLSSACVVGFLNPQHFFMLTDYQIVQDSIESVSTLALQTIGIQNPSVQQFTQVEDLLIKALLKIFFQFRQKSSGDKRV